MQFENAGSAASWADHVAALLIDRVTRAPALRLILPTGLTPVPIYDRLADAVARGVVSFGQAEVFLLDEFGSVAPTDPGRCDQMLTRMFVARVDLSRGRFHRFTLDGDVAKECRRYEALVGGGCDLALLGIGTNGHLGMNEPGSPPDSLTRRVQLAASTVAASARYFGRDTDLPTWGVTLGLGTLARSREVWILASGSGKAAIVRDTLRAPMTPDVPSTLLRDHPGA